LTKSFIAIKGNFLNNLTKIFETFNYVDFKQDKLFNNWNELNTYLHDNYFEFTENDIALRGIWFNNGWTIISDPEMVDVLEEDKMQRLSAKLDAELITFLIQSTSGSFGFTVYNQTIKRRFFVSNGKAVDNLFEPLKEELGLNINEYISVNDIVYLAEDLGIDLQGKSDNTFVVKQLEYNDEMKAELEQFKQQAMAQDVTKKPWWKIW
jgi:hypothetical protein